MRIKLDYGRDGLWVDVPDDRAVEVLELSATPPIADPNAAIEAALARPIGTPALLEVASGKRNACILICDITRPVPNREILTPLLRTLHHAGLQVDDILILVATGLHRPNTREELTEMVGAEIVDTYRIVNHDGRDASSHTNLGTTPAGVPVFLDSRYIEADLKITTGLIEPHLMAGFSGGRKVICPGIASIETVRAWHSPRFLEHPNATCGMLEGNPVHEENTRIAQMAGCDFIANVCIDGDRRITDVVAGDMIEAWRRGVSFCEQAVTVTLSEPVDVVVTTSAGYPLDTTFYQSVKGLTGALPIVKKGGTIVLAAGLAEGIGSPEFTRLLAETRTLDEFMQRINDDDFFVMDQWQLEELARVVRHCKVKVVSDGLPAETLCEFFVEPADSVESAVEASLKECGPAARLAVIPKGPYVLAKVA